jgi:hypothetical protein
MTYLLFLFVVLGIFTILTLLVVVILDIMSIQLCYLSSFTLASSSYSSDSSFSWVMSSSAGCSSLSCLGDMVESGAEITEMMMANKRALRFRGSKKVQRFVMNDMRRRYD